MLKILLLDNYDSFTYNLAAFFDKYSYIDLKVQTPDETNIDNIIEFDRIVFSPGPGLPSEKPLMNRILIKYHKTHPILGICLGHQAIGTFFGAKLVLMDEVFHGKQKKMIISENSRLLKNIPQKSKIGLYHSWVLDKKNFPKCLNISAECENGKILAIEHKKYNIAGLQFHPESFITEYGKTIIDNWLEEK